MNSKNKKPTFQSSNFISYEKVYKILAQQEKISHQEAKRYCDMGIVYIGDKKIKKARTEIAKNTKIKLLRVPKIKIVFEDDDLIAIHKPALINSDDCLKKFPKATLLHRLDKPTSGILLLAKNEEFRLKVIEEFRAHKVYKEYLAIVFGLVKKKHIINRPLLSQKKNNQYKTIVSPKGKPALTEVHPLEVKGKKSKVKVIIPTGRTHQIRVHLANLGFPIVGDQLYGKPSRAKRLMLHAKKISFLNYTLEVKEGNDFVF